MGNFLYLLVAELSDILKKLGLVLPELTLPIRSKRSCSRLPSVFVVPERKMLKDEFHFVGVFLKHLLKQRQKPRTVRSLVVVENSDLHRCVNWPFKRRT